MAAAEFAALRAELDGLRLASRAELATHWHEVEAALLAVDAQAGAALSAERAWRARATEQLQSAFGALAFAESQREEALVTAVDASSAAAGAEARAAGQVVVEQQQQQLPLLQRSVAAANEERLEAAERLVRVNAESERTVDRATELEERLCALQADLEQSRAETAEALDAAGEAIAAADAANAQRATAEVAVIARGEELATAAAEREAAAAEERKAEVSRLGAELATTARARDTAAEVARALASECGVSPHVVTAALIPFDACNGAESETASDDALAALLDAAHAAREAAAAAAAQLAAAERERAVRVAREGIIAETAPLQVESARALAEAQAEVRRLQTEVDSAAEREAATVRSAEARAARARGAAAEAQAALQALQTARAADVTGREADAAAEAELAAANATLPLKVELEEREAKLAASQHEAARTLASTKAAHAAAMAAQRAEHHTALARAREDALKRERELTAELATVQRRVAEAAQAQNLTEARAREAAHISSCELERVRAELSHREEMHAAERADAERQAEREAERVAQLEARLLEFESMLSEHTRRGDSAERELLDVTALLNRSLNEVRRPPLPDWMARVVRARVPPPALPCPALPSYDIVTAVFVPRHTTLDRALIQAPRTPTTSGRSAPKASAPPASLRPRRSGSRGALRGRARSSAKPRRPPARLHRLAWTADRLDRPSRRRRSVGLWALRSPRKPRYARVPLAPPPLRQARSTALGRPQEAMLAVAEAVAMLP